MRRLLVVLIVLGALAFGADLVAARLAADEAEQQLAQRGFVGVSVQFDDLPFLTQLADRRFSTVSVSARAVEAEAGRATNVRASLRDVAAPQGGPVRVGSLQATGTVSYDEVVREADVPSLRLERAAHGQVRLSRRVLVLGKELDVAARGRVEALGDRVRVIPTDIDVDGAGLVDDQLAEQLAGQLALDYPIPDLPKGVRIERITPALDGFVVRVSGRDVVLPPG